MQKTSGEGLCQAKQYNPVAAFVDTGKSGWDPKTKREGFEELMRWVREHRLDVVVIFSLSRLTRKGALDALEIEAEMRAHGVTLISVQEPYLDTSDAIGIGIFAIIAGLAKQESDNKSAFIRNSREAAREAGGHLTGNAPFGMRSVKQRTPEGVSWIQLVPEDEEIHFRSWTEADTVRRIIDLAIGDPLRGIPGRSPGAITEWLNAEAVPPPGQRALHKKADRFGRFQPANGKKKNQPYWARTVVARILRDPRYAGMAADRAEGNVGWTIRRDEANNPIHSHEGLVSVGRWFQLQNALGPSGKKNRASEKAQLLSGWRFGTCDCGAWSSNSHINYLCGRPGEARKKHFPGHTINSIRIEAADEYVTQRVFARMLNLDTTNDEDLTLMREAARRFAAQTDTSGIGKELVEFKAQLEHTDQSLMDLYEERPLYKGAAGKKAWKSAVATMLATQEKCRDRIEELESMQADRVVLPIDEWYGTHGADPTGEGSPWASWPVVRRREFLSLWLDSVTFSQADGKRLPPEERITLQWARPVTEDDDEGSGDTGDSETLAVL